MPRRYRLRLGDGTILMVDQQGLNTWKVDSKAMVQAAGGNWRPLKDLLAMQLAAAKYAEQNAPRPSPPPSTVLPLVPPPPKKDKSEPRKPSTVLPLVPPPPRSQKLRPPTARPAPEPVPAPVVDEPSPVFEPSSMVLEAASIPAVPDLPPEPIVDLGPQQELAPLPDAFARDETPVLGAPEPPAPQAWADEPAAEEPAPFAAPFEPALPPVEDVVVATQDEVAVFAPPEPTVTERPWDPEPSQWSDAVEPPAIGASRTVQTLADDPVPRQGYSDEHFSHGGSSSYTSPSPSPSEDRRSYTPSEPGFEEEEPDDFYYRKPRPIVLDERFVRVLNVVGVVLSKALDVLERMSGDLWDALGKAWASRAARRAEAIAREAPREELRTSFVQPEVEPEPPAVRALADEPSVSWRDDAPARPAPTEDLAIIPLKPQDAEGSVMERVQKSARSLGAGIAGWAQSLRGRVEDLVRRNRPAPAPSAPWNEPEPSSSSFSYAPPPRETHRPPPTTNEIPVIRMAKIEDEPVEPEDLYDGPSESAYFPTAWLWTKRLAWTALFAAGAFLVYENWEAWSPKAKTISTTALTEVTRFAENRELRVREQQALLAATEQLPHLTPDTIRLVLSRSTSGVPPDPPEVFQVTCDAADRGLPALTPEEREELSALRKTLLEALSPAERILLREYDEVRSRRPSFAFEDKSALALFARGVRGMPAESLERFKVLLGQAISAGLGSPTESEAPKPKG